MGTELLQPVITVVAVAFGWLLNELSQWFRQNRDDRAAVGQLLVFLAETRHELTVMREYFRTVSKKFQLTAFDLQLARDFFQQILAESDNTEERFEDSIHLLAGRQPGLAFQLRSKNRIPAFLREWRKLSGGDPFATQHFSKMEDCLNSFILPEIDRTINILARKHGLRTWFYYRTRIRKWNDVSNMQREFEKLLDDMQRCVNESQKHIPSNS